LNARLPVRIFVTFGCLDGFNTDQPEMNEGGSVPLEKPPPSGASADTRLKLMPGHSAGFLVFCPTPLFMGGGIEHRNGGDFRLSPLPTAEPRV